MPATVEAELYRANPIESYDTAFLRCRTTDGIPLLFATSHAAPRRVGPLFRLECEHATITYGEEEPRDEVVVRYHDGRVVCYGQPDRDRPNKLWQCIEIARQGSGEVACGIEAAVPHTLCVAAARQSSDPLTIDDSYITETETPDGPTRVVTDMEQTLMQCYSGHVLPTELGVKWARPGRTVHVNESALDEAGVATRVDRDLTRVA